MKATKKPVTIDCKKCPAKETCTVDYWKGCGDNFMEWAKSEA